MSKYASFQQGFFDELEKIAWFGTYYHGTSPSAEKSILREGLKTRHGGTGAASLLGDIQPDNPSLGKFEKETKGKIALSRSKTLAKIYGGAQDPKLIEGLLEAKKGVQKGARGRSVRELLTARPGVKKALQAFSGNVPLEISGKELKGLKRDPSHFFLGVQSAKDIPPELITKGPLKGKKLPSVALRFLERLAKR